METKKGEKMDRRVRKTRAQLRAGLARLMQQKNIKEITVKELVDEIDINRSTFYLHYTDIYQILHSRRILEQIHWIFLSWLWRLKKHLKLKYRVKIWKKSKRSETWFLM